MRERYLYLLAALALMFLAYPVAVETGTVRWFRLAFASLLVIVAWAVSGRRPRVLATALALGLPALAAQIAAVVMDSRVVLLFAASCALLFLAYVTLVLFASVLRPGRVTRDRIAGAICVYLLIGLAWAMAYTALAVARPEAFSAPRELLQGLGSGSEYGFVYFSFVTLTTLGYGDITPASPVSHTLAWMEAVVGQLFLAILIARLVGLHIAHGEGDRG